VTARAAADQFALAAPASRVTPFGRGLINETYLVETEAGDYVLQRINEAVFGDAHAVMANIVAVRSHIEAGIIPELVPARAGGWLVTEAGGVWRAWQRVAGESVTEPTPTRAASAARLLARFHRALADLDPAGLVETLPGFHDPERRRAQLERAIADDPCDRAAGVGAEIAAARAVAPLAALAHDISARVPRSIAHNDAQLPNFVFRGDEAIALLDLDTVMPGPQFWDLGDLVRTAVTRSPEDDPEPARHVADPELLAAIVDGYGAPADATRAAGALITYEQALRFLTDWILGDVYYRTTRPGQNLDRARGQLILLASLRGTVGA
jgi:Ser/Thr protein kinase RdoA (MazF antagonist)